MASSEQINAFVCVYELGGYSAAAKQLSKSRTTVRELILTLEEEHHLALFEVVGRSVKPTENADRLYASAKSVQMQLMSFNALTSSLHDEEEARITLYYDTMLPNAFIADLTSLMLIKFPHLELYWKVSAWQDSMDSIVKNPTSITFMPTRRRNYTDVKVDIMMLGHIDFAAYAGNTAVFNTGKPITAADLRILPQVIPESFRSSDLNDYMRYSTNSIYIGNNDAACGVLTKVGWAFLPKQSAEKYVENGQLIKLDISELKMDYLKVSLAASQLVSVNQGPAMQYLNSLLPDLAKKHFT